MPVCVTNGPSSPRPSEGSQRHGLWSEGRTECIFRAQRHWLLVFCCNPLTRKCLLIHILMLGNWRFYVHAAQKMHQSFSQMVYVQCLDGMHTGLNAPIAPADGNQSLSFDSLLWTCLSEPLLTRRSFFPGQVVPVQAQCTSKAKSCHPCPSQVSSLSLQMELMLSAVHHLYLVEKVQPKKFLLWCLRGVPRARTSVGFLAPSGIVQGFASSQINATSVAGNSVTGWFRTSLHAVMFS